MLCKILGIVLLDSNGNRLAVKYMPSAQMGGPHHHSYRALIGDYASQIKLEANLQQKVSKLSSRTDVEVMMLDGILALFKTVNDLTIYVLAGEDENEIMLSDIVNTVYQALTTITGGQVGRRQVLEQLDSVFLMLDETLDGGVILEIDPNVITSRVNMNDGTNVCTANGSTQETAFNQAIHHAKENLMRSFLSSAS